MERTEERISGLVGKTITVTQSEQQRKRERRNTQRLRDIWDYNKRSNIHVTEVPGEEKKREGLSKEIISENFLNLANNTNLLI